uniref:Uncharacterized protein n=1 Tax=Aegilops tauschii subsp. strangulata TaxID=200361 RepID=A0A453HLM4_AEGTS
MVGMLLVLCNITSYLDKFKTSNSGRREYDVVVRPGKYCRAGNYFLQPKSTSYICFLDLCLYQVCCSNTS